MAVENLEQINGASFGTSGILQGWIDLAKKKKLSSFETLVINLFTVFRNAYDKDKSLTQNVEQFNTDLFSLLLHYSNHVTGMILKDSPNVVLYVPSYHRVPKIHVREEAPAKAKLREQFTKYVDKTYKENSMFMPFNNLNVNVFKCGIKDLPQKELYKLINGLLMASYKVTSSRRYGLISHIPLDYHIFPRFNNNVELFDSHTGNVWNIKTLGEKVFKSPDIPFNSVTHLLLGDKELLRCILLRKDRKRVYELAKQQRWNQQTKQQIARSLDGITLSEFVTSLDL